MSRLYRTEEGHVIPTLCEELTRFRRARKVLQIPPTESWGTLYLLARAYPRNDYPLHVAVNGTELPSVSAETKDKYLWYQVDLDPLLLEAGDNHFDFWTDAGAMDAWSLAIEAGHRRPWSWVSDDRGETWRNEKMAYLNALRGEYVVRVRLAEGRDPPPPALVVWEQPHSPRVSSLRAALPPDALHASSQMDRVRALTGWLSSSWEHTSSGVAGQYAPWDAETILAWGKAGAGHDGRLPIVMCVHYAVAFVSSCQAAGIPARCAVLSSGVNRSQGHFVAEVWFDNYQKWVMVDPNLDAIMWKGGQPMSLPEIREAGDEIHDLIEFGPGIRYQLQNPRIEAWLEEVYYPGLCFRHRSVWWRADLLSRPEFSPPGHGSVAYCETGLIWEEDNLQHGFGMFPYFAPPAFFSEPPLT